LRLTIAPTSPHRFRADRVPRRPLHPPPALGHSSLKSRSNPLHESRSEEEQGRTGHSSPKSSSNLLPESRSEELGRGRRDARGAKARRWMDSQFLPKRQPATTRGVLKLSAHTRGNSTQTPYAADGSDHSESRCSCSFSDIGKQLGNFWLDQINEPHSGGKAEVKAAVLARGGLV
jgi:hypothetical protein